jgi:uncharacterized membrane protein YdjX (TVP38/TMEM64 family)
MRRPSPTKLMRLLVVIAILFAAIVVAVHFHDYATIRNLGRREAELARFERQSPGFVVFVFMTIQIVSLCLCIPGAVFSLALLGGALFGPLEGTVIVLLSVTIGDTVSFLAARFVLRDWVERRFGSQLHSVERGIETDGAYYLLSMRLLPIPPFFIVNLTMGVTRMPLRVFAPVSFIGLAPSVSLHVEAGTRLSEITSRADVLSIKVVLIFALLGALPIVTHVALKSFRGRRVFKD